MLEELECHGCGECFRKINDLTTWKGAELCEDCLVERQDKEYAEAQRFNDGLEAAAKECESCADISINTATIAKRIRALKEPAR